MQKWILDNCLHQLIKVYAFSVQRYICASVNFKAPILKVFSEQRALERMTFIDNLQTAIDSLENAHPKKKSLEELYREHTEIYGRNVLKITLITEIDCMVIDKKALEICDCLLTDRLPENIISLLTFQATKIESGVLSMMYLKKLYDS